MNQRKRGKGFRFKAIMGTLGTIAATGATISQTDLPMWMRIAGGVVALGALGFAAWLGLPRLIKWATEDIRNDA